MKALFIGGTGTISMGIIRRLAAETDWEVFLLNRGNRKAEVPDGVRQIVTDISREADVAALLKDMSFDTVCEFIGFTRESEPGVSAGSLDLTMTMIVFTLIVI